MDGERRLLKMMNPNKHSNSGFSLKELDHQVEFICLLQPFCCYLRWCLVQILVLF